MFDDSAPLTHTHTHCIMRSSSCVQCSPPLQLQLLVSLCLSSLLSHFSVVSPLSSTIVYRFSLLAPRSSLLVSSLSCASRHSHILVETPHRPSATAWFPGSPVPVPVPVLVLVPFRLPPLMPPSLFVVRCSLFVVHIALPPEAAVPRRSPSRPS
ncbi:hypothetical protein L226DRAFT_210644 [Lentinus tigrinus ALCF2SS1-7]|uniref:Uncharacterized protein n=1 Tax=Lentinus tigrinus ALCF2SS1-6 TaxID=1328759 RepID=A0A5C2S0K0_9APHY|nr:hypothetical protein L227DRAFT_245926 [Lentinus tigrinus ALCF2SS1-6]RPD71188.1 hypothetical protein L226DRAFT_210644 [Lentinus tigrinus ALCF2SS1-7]